MECSKLVATFAVLALGVVCAQNPQLTVCSVNRGSHCQQLARTELKCVEKKHKVDCAINVNNGNMDFTSLTAEEALLAAKFSPDLTVIGEIRPGQEILDSTEFELAIVVKAGFEGGFQNLKGKRLCSPGFNMKSASNYVVKEFEDEVLKRNNLNTCSKFFAERIAEQHIKNLYDTFGDSCRPGAWVADTELDKHLKAKYSKLNALCPDEKHGDFKKALDCLTTGKGDIAVTTINNVNAISQRNEYQLLCKDGSFRSIGQSCGNPSWTKQPRSLIVANSKTANAVKNWMVENMTNFAFTAERSLRNSTQRAAGGFTTEDLLQKVLYEDDTRKIALAAYPKNLKTYMEEFRPIPEINYGCGKMTWCTISEAEQVKCQWAAQAAANLGIVPAIDCKQSTSKLNCLQDINNRVADVTNVEDYGYVAQRRKLEGLAYPETEPEFLAKYIIVIKESSKQEYKSLEDLKGKKGCFSEFGGNAWMAFVNRLRNASILPSDSCDYGKLVSDFLGESCMPGARNPLYAPTEGTNADKMCKLCVSQKIGTAVTCNADDTNLHYGNDGAIKCLETFGDFAVIKAENFTNHNIHDYKFRVLCSDGNLAPETKFQVSEECALTVVTDSEVVTRRADTKYNDFALAFLEFENKFTIDTPFEMFNIFNDTLHLLFPDSTPGLDTANSTNQYVKNYIQLFQHAEYCAIDKGSAAVAFISSTLLFAAVAFNLFRNY